MHSASTIDAPPFLELPMLSMVLTIWQAAEVQKAFTYVQVFLIPTPGDRLEGSAIMVFCFTYALHASGQTSRLRGNAQSGSLARELNAVEINFLATSTATPEQRRRKGVQGACRNPLACQGVARHCSRVRFSNGTNEGEGQTRYIP